MSTDGTSVRRLEQASEVAADGKKDASQVWKFDTAFSPDGGSIAFTGMVDGDLELFTIKTDGTGLTRLAHRWGDDLHPVWTRR